VENSTRVMETCTKRRLWTLVLVTTERSDYLRHALFSGSQSYLVGWNVFNFPFALAWGNSNQKYSKKKLKYFRRFLFSFFSRARNEIRWGCLSRARIIKLIASVVAHIRFSNTKYNYMTLKSLLKCPTSILY